MKILFLNSSKEWGGNEKWTLSAATDLALLGHSVYLGCRSGLFPKKHPEGVLKFVTFSFANVFDFITLLKIRSFIKKNSIDVVIPTKQREYLIGGLASRKITKIAARFGIDRPLHNFRNRFAFCNLFDMVIVNSKKIIQTLSLTHGFDVKKCKLVYNGIAIPELSNEVRMKYRKELMLAENEYCVMCIGRLSSQKGIDFALEAFAQTCKKISNSRLVIVGSGSQSGEYENLAKQLGVDSKVNFTGHRDDTSGLLQAADLFWLTSRSEGMSNALLEAMAHAKATIAFDIAGVSEAIQNNVTGVIVAPEAVTMLANESIVLLGDPSKREYIGKNARDHVINNFTKEKSVSSLESVLLELVGE